MSDDRNTGTSAGEPSPMQAAGGCVVLVLCVWFEISFGIAIAALVAEAVAPALAARGYNIRTGSGFVIAAGLGAIIAIYPVIWLHRLGRILRGRAGLRVR